MNSERIECLVLLKSPHETPIYLMVAAEFSQEDVDKERTNPGSSIIDYTFNEKVILRDRYFKQAVLGSSFDGMTDNNDAFQFVRFITKDEANRIIAGIIGNESYASVAIDDDYEQFMHELFPECAVRKS